jgi:hypothetical protein
MPPPPGVPSEPLGFPSSPPRPERPERPPTPERPLAPEPPPIPDELPPPGIPLEFGRVPVACIPPIPGAADDPRDMPPRLGPDEADMPPSIPPMPDCCIPGRPRPGRLPMLPPPAPTLPPMLPMSPRCGTGAFLADVPAPPPMPPMPGCCAHTDTARARTARLGTRIRITRVEPVRCIASSPLCLPATRLGPDRLHYDGIPDRVVGGLGEQLLRDQILFPCAGAILHDRRVTAPAPWPAATGHEPPGGLPARPRR